MISLASQYFHEISKQLTIMEFEENVIIGMVMKFILVI